MAEIRLQKALAQAGLGSRRRCDDMIAHGRVEVNGEIIDQMGSRVDPLTDVIRVDGKRIPPPNDHAYVLLNKPRGIVTSMADEHGRPDLSSLLKGREDRLFHVGRLDTDTSGLLLLTNDGDLAHKLAHPSFEITKTYVALVDGNVADTVAATLKAGIELDDGPAIVDRFLVKDRSRGKSIVELDIHMGRNRIVRRMLDAVGHPVIELNRSAFGPLDLRGLAAGAMRNLSREELGALFDSVEA
ncbi:23S rRNA pseudouridine2605 synthase [Aeromicrobium panaciterrae]|uniref:Pseudouridine synthase n=1 Tax=Aeromicrobium panaciterrae TaxID=363861 RepID=A0ABU1UNS8_9ACTN|nr:pseudouridine synthase [Aeromicrobium panaciterrae]MDR7086815.1 23S rRNA pseudouridine2605 synthase [Aeromicrobium panaciterrae]